MDYVYEKLEDLAVQYFNLCICIHLAELNGEYIASFLCPVTELHCIKKDDKYINK